MKRAANHRHRSPHRDGSLGQFLLKAAVLVSVSRFQPKLCPGQSALESSVLRLRAARSYKTPDCHWRPAAATYRPGPARAEARPANTPYPEATERPGSPAQRTAASISALPRYPCGAADTRHPETTEIRRCPSCTSSQEGVERLDCLAPPAA